MSGGHFQYQESALRTIAEQLEADLSDEEAGPYQDVLRRTISNIESLYEALYVYDRGMSGDRSIEEGFEALRSYLAKLKEA